MTRLRQALLPSVVVAVVVALLAAPLALAAPNRVILDCNLDGALERDYSNRELRQALDELPSDIDEYSNCRELIQAAITSGGGRRGGAGGGSEPALPAEHAARAADAGALGRIAGGGGAPPSLKVGGERVTPGTNGLFNLATADHDLPLPLLLALVGLALLTLAAGFAALPRRFPALARLGSKLPAPRVSLPRFRR